MGCVNAQVCFLYMWNAYRCAYVGVRESICTSPPHLESLHHIAGVGIGSSNTFQGCQSNWNWPVNVYWTAVCHFIVGSYTWLRVD